MKDKYDYIIVGSGVAGNVCAFELQKKGYSCLIVEKNNNRCEKICGGGIPYKALHRLQEIGMNLDALYDKDVACIGGDIIHSDGKQVETVYDSGRNALGCRRVDFDTFLFSEAQKLGADIYWGVNVNKIDCSKNGYMIDKFYSRKVVIAAGARGLENKYYKGQSIGVSTQIVGESTYPSDRFTYFYLSDTADKYFWIFPVGKNIWNIGLWSMVPEQSMRETFSRCWNRYIEPAFRAYNVLQSPRAEFCGNVAVNIIESIACDAIGDYAGTNNIKNGGGIYKAIKSAISYATMQQIKE